jgi:hypothetical protein
MLKINHGGKAQFGRHNNAVACTSAQRWLTNATCVQFARDTRLVTCCTCLRAEGILRSLTLSHACRKCHIEEGTTEPLQGFTTYRNSVALCASHFVVLQEPHSLDVCTSCLSASCFLIAQIAHVTLVSSNHSLIIYLEPSCASRTIVSHSRP